MMIHNDCLLDKIILDQVTILWWDKDLGRTVLVYSPSFLHDIFEAHSGWLAKR